MRRKFFYIFLLIVIALTSWIYWKSKDDYNTTYIILKNNNFVSVHTVLEPQNKTCQGTPLFVIIVTSYVGHVELRSAHRRAMPQDELTKLNVARVFLLAQIPETEKYITQASIKDESDMFGDILQGSFIENYRNLTLKHLMGLQWASKTCNKASYILKVDDDTVFNFKKTYDLIKSLKTNYSPDLFMGYMLNNTKPRRNRQNKWYVTYNEYSRHEYPPYLSGWYYIVTPKLAAKLCNEAIFHPYFWIDDILITGILTESLGIKLKQLPSEYWLEYYELLECCLNDMMKKSIECDYVVGPNGRRNSLILEFNNAYRDCTEQNCTKRTSKDNLKKKCVAFKDRSIFSDGGQAEVRYLKL